MSSCRCRNLIPYGLNFYFRNHILVAKWCRQVLLLWKLMSMRLFSNKPSHGSDEPIRTNPGLRNVNRTTASSIRLKLRKRHQNAGGDDVKGMWRNSQRPREIDEISLSKIRRNLCQIDQHLVESSVKARTKQATSIRLKFSDPLKRQNYFVESTKAWSIRTYFWDSVIIFVIPTLIRNK